METRPEYVTDDHIEYLDTLSICELGGTNLFRARPYVQEEFCLDRHMAEKIVSYWLTTF